MMGKGPVTTPSAGEPHVKNAEVGKLNVTTFAPFVDFARVRGGNVDISSLPRKRQSTSRALPRPADIYADRIDLIRQW